MIEYEVDQHYSHAVRMEDSLTTSSLRAIRWNYAGFLTRSLAGLGVGIVLARLLGPKPFGQLGVAAIVFGLGNQFADAGFSSALVQAPELDERQIRFAFTMQVLIGCGMTGLTFVAAPFFGAIFRDDGVINVLRVVSLLFVLQGLGQTSTGLLKRRMDFRALQTAQVSSYLIGYGAVGVAAAYLGLGVWSLVAAQLIQPLLYSVHTYWYVRHSLRPCIHRSGLRLLRFGTQVTGANLINWTISNLDNVLVGRTFGSTSLGLYSRVFNLASNPVTGFVGTLQQVLFASCSRAGPSFDHIRRAYLAALGGVALITMPLFWSLAACSRPVVVGLYGPRWAEAVPLFAAFSVAMPLFAVMAIAGPILGAADRVSQEIRTQAASLLVSGAVFAVAARVSLTSVAWAVVFAYGFRLWCASRPTLRLLCLRWRDVAGVMVGPVCAALFTAGCVFWASRTVFYDGVKPTFGLPAIAIIGVISFITGALIGGRHVLPRAVLDPVLAHRNEFPWFVSRGLTILAARWHPSLTSFAQKVAAEADATEP